MQNEKLKYINKNVTSNKTKHVEGEKKLNNLWKKVKLLSTKGHNFLLGRTYFIGHDGYQFFLTFAPMLISLTLNSNKKVILSRY